MRRLRSTKLLSGGAIVLAILGSAAVAACGGGDSEKSASAPEGFDSACCVTARNWAAHELSGDGDAQCARGGPTALRKWWTEQAAYLKTSVEQAPPEIRDAGRQGARDAGQVDAGAREVRLRSAADRGQGHPPEQALEA